MRTASARLMPEASRRRRSSGGVSTSKRVPPSLSTYAPTLVLLSRGSVERQTAQVQPTYGTPKLPPVPRKVSFSALARVRPLQWRDAEPGERHARKRGAFVVADHAEARESCGQH